MENKEEYVPIFIKSLGRKLVGQQGQTQAIALYKCICGKEFEALINNINKGNTRSCGCLHKKIISENTKTHGMTRTTEYNIWLNMKARCYNKNEPAYKNYGGRGITLCDRWLESFENFYKDMGNRPIKHTIDRINNDGNYCKENCRWVTMLDQSHNKRNNRLLEVNGIIKRIRNGWSTTDAIFIPNTRNTKILFNNKNLTWAQWSKITGWNRRVLQE